MGYLDELRSFVSENAPYEALTKPTEPGSVSSVGTSQDNISEIEARATLKRWHRHLSAIDQFCTPADWTLNNWLTLTDDAFWLYENHASYAVRNGWTALDLFGVRPGMPHRGGLADMLETSRDLKLNGGRAFWTQLGVKRRINVGCGEGCALLWELR